MIPIYNYKDNNPDRDVHMRGATKETHQEAIKEIQQFFKTYNAFRFTLYATVVFSSGATTHEYHGRLIAIANKGLVVEAMATPDHKGTINWRRISSEHPDYSLEFMHPTYDELFPNGKHMTLVHTYPPMDMIKIVYAKPNAASNADLKPVLLKGIE